MGKTVREPAHKRDIISQLRMHKPSETSGVCSRAIQEIESLRNALASAPSVFKHIDDLQFTELKAQLAAVSKERDELKELLGRLHLLHDPDSNAAKAIREALSPSPVPQQERAELR